MNKEEIAAYNKGIEMAAQFHYETAMKLSRASASFKGLESRIESHHTSGKLILQMKLQETEDQR